MTPRTTAKTTPTRTPATRLRAALTHRPHPLHRRLHGVDSTLERDLRTFRSPAELAELKAILDRYSDEDTATIRTAVDWTAAA